MRTRSAKTTTVLLTAALMTATSACSAGGGDPHAAGDAGETPRTAATASATSVTDDELGAALDALVLVGGQGPRVDAADCLADEVRGSGVSEQALAALVEQGGDDWGAAVAALGEEHSEDAQKLLSPGLRSAFDECVDSAVFPDGPPEEQADYPAPAPPPAYKSGEPDLEPTIELDHRDVTLANQLEPGLAAVLASFAFDEKQEQVYTEAAGCMAQVAVDSGMSPEALSFLGSGPRIGAGSIAEHLPPEDQEIWESASMVRQLSDCAKAAQDRPSDDEGDEG